MVVSGLLAGLVLAGCGPRIGEDERNRRFAEQSRPPAVTATVVEDSVGTPITAMPGQPIGTPLPIDSSDLLLPQGGPESAFFVADGQLLIATAAGELLTPELPGAVSALSVSPAGDRAAILLGPGAAATPEAGAPVATPAIPASDGLPDPVAFDEARVVILGPDGETLRTIDDLSGLAGIAASEQAPGDGVSTLALGPGSDDLIVGLADGLLIRVPETAEPAPIPGSGNLADIRQVIWEPDGSGIAITASGKSGEPVGLYYSPIRVDGIDLVRLAPGRGRSAGNATWLPDGSGILFTDATGPVSADTLRQGRDLFVSRLRTDRRNLVVAAGVIGPSAGVGQVVPGPDGLIAYLLVRAEGDEVRISSLRVGRIGTSTVVDVRLPASGTVAGLGWTSAGLMVLTSDDTGPTVYLVGGDGVPQPLDAAPADATPTTSPVAASDPSVEPAPSVSPAPDEADPASASTPPRRSATVTATPDRTG
ncbi:MAG TPA: hypothetical protein VGT61_08050 [Thermomicrobiales bacterium]|jgi:hypothetical protein|nr:hypothetical protein [Thermomicrobiales bacterium]